jgi:hypothetical protein
MDTTHHTLTTVRGALLLCASVCFGIFTTVAIAAVDAVKPSNGWRIECSGNAESSGTIQFRVLPHQGDVVTVAVKIEKGRSENQIAQAIRDAFRARLSPDRFQAETDDGEDVLVKKKAGQPDFAIELVSANVKNFRMNLQRE